MGNGADDFGISYQPDVILTRAQDVPVVSVAGIVQHPLNSVMALDSSGIERPSDLIGKKVGYPGIPTDEPLLDTMLRFDGARGLEDVERVNVGFDLVPALLGGTVDAIVGDYWTHESILMENQGYPVRVLRMEEWGVPDYYELVLVTSEKMVEEHPETVERFVRAVRRGFMDAISDPQKGVDFLLSGTKDEVDEAIEQPGADLLKASWREGTAAFGSQDTAKWEGYIRWMRNGGLLVADVDIGRAVTDEFTD